MRYLLLALFLLPLNKACSQEYVYVNTPNLLLRQRPDPLYLVFAVLQPPCRLRLINLDGDKYYSKAITNRFYHVTLLSYDKKGRGATYTGWVEKKYMVKVRPSFPPDCLDTANESFFTPVHIISYSGEEEHDPNNWNCLNYPYPKYKGGEKSFPSTSKSTPQRVYHTGSRGGCYYIGGTGKKVYVDGKFCKKKKALVPKSPVPAKQGHH